MSEHDEQVALFQWAAWQALDVPDLALLFAIPNGGHRHKATAGKMKAEGVKAGVPDIMLPVARRGYHGLFGEMKYGRNKPTAEQDVWIRELHSQGYYCPVAYSWQQMARELAWYLEFELPFEVTD